MDAINIHIPSNLTKKVIETLWYNQFITILVYIIKINLENIKCNKYKGIDRTLSVNKR